MRAVIAGVALATSLLAFVVIAGTGLFLAAFEQSGARFPGLLMALGGAAAFAAALYVGLAAPARFHSRAAQALAAAATFLAVIPPTALACAALVFAGLPLGSAMPALDWTFFAAGLGFAFGAAAMAALGYLRVRDGGRKSGRPPAVVSTSGERHHAGLM